jgi:hypothetical protein
VRGGGVPCSHLCRHHLWRAPRARADAGAGNSGDSLAVQAEHNLVSCAAEHDGVLPALATGELKVELLSGGIARLHGLLERGWVSG